MSAASGGKIVVGVDGSEPSKAALRWALRQAGLTGGWVSAVISWDAPPIYGWEAAPSRDDLNTNAAHILGEVIAEVADDQGGITIGREVANGHPAKALLSSAEDAELLVLGNRGRGGFSKALLGSVTAYITHHAACPVVVVRTAV
ncbi:universal stress protein [Saccharopolyspora sp. HNM0983]|uniref:Universal stress protein n=1 Tax=Saccharopolyspora montiporae TaxID=2781240 RepID=A0A929G054_9PSEU|nr:universal stress protein [Saccharopolyspora sp. HNM0983]MBE9375245.1 universal stress protein [Saccharopolyspora sp. HNM0983]